MLGLAIIAALFLFFAVMIWRVSRGPSNSEEALGNNSPYPSSVLGTIGPLGRIAGSPELGTPESLESEDDPKFP